MNGLSRARVMGTLLTIVIVVAVIGGLFLLGPPAEERARRLDERRIRDLTSLARAIDLYWTRHAKPPSSLDELRREPGGNVRIVDPNSNQRYEYRPLGTETYEVCAQFDRDSQQADLPRADGFWSHTTGRQCFQRAAKKVN